MTVYIYDRDPPGREAQPRREWAELVAPLEPREWDPDHDVAERGDVVICHWTYVGEKVRAAAQVAAARGVAVMFISGGQLSGKLDRGAYHRQAFVDKPADPAFTAAFRRFVKYLKANNGPRWDLIEPIAAPEHLLAYYLCLIADMKELVGRPIDGGKLLDLARAECDHLLMILNDPSLPRVGCELTRDNVKRILSAI
jgi:hypothetical protein